MSKKLLLLEAYNCFKFLMDNTNFIETSTGYGLTLDRYKNNEMASIAASGFMLTSLVIGVERKWLTYEEAKKRATLTLKNFYYNIPHFQGFFVHFANFNDGTRYKKTEYSTIDTALFINGMLVVDSYFNDIEISEYSSKIYKRITFNSFISTYNNHKVLKMAYNDLKNGDYRNGSEDNFIYQWHMSAEQLCLYFLCAGSETINEELASALYYGFYRTVGGYKHYQFVYSPQGSLFTHLFSHAWINFNEYVDEKGFNWFINTKNAILANYEYCKDNPNNFKTFKSYCWGVSASDGPKGYRGYGLPPYGLNVRNNDSYFNTDGTIAPYALVSSLPFVPKLVDRSYKVLIKKHPNIIGKYGLYDAFNFENGEWIDQDYISIDKGVSLLMIDNHYYKTTWTYFHKHPLIIKAVAKLNYKKVV